MKHTLVFRVCKDPTEGLVATNDELHMVSFGRNPAELLADIGRDFAWLWEEYVEADPKELTEGAVKFGQQLKQLLESGVTICLKYTGGLKLSELTKVARTMDRAHRGEIKEYDKVVEEEYRALHPELTQFHIDYDALADVLYVCWGKAKKAYVVEDQEMEGLHYRYSLEDDELCGVTVVWFSRQDVDTLLKKFREIELPPRQLEALGLQPGWQEKVTQEIARLVSAAPEERAKALRNWGGYR